MRHAPIPARLFVENRARLRALLHPRSLVALNNNDVLPTNADGTLVIRPNSDLFYLTGVEQEESILLLFPDALEERNREILFLRETTPFLETWEGRKLSKPQAAEVSGIARVEWLQDFPVIFRGLMCEAESLYLNSNEHPRAVPEVQTRDARFIRECQEQYPLHTYRRLAPLLHELRAVKSDKEIKLIRKACEITRDGFKRVARALKPGVTETELEAEYAHEFIRQGAGFAYSPIIATGANACGLHYLQNTATCRAGELVLMDVGASYANYNADMTRTIPVSGKFTRRQKQLYNAVLRVFYGCKDALCPGQTSVAWRDLAMELMTRELVDLGLIKLSDARKQGKGWTATRKYFMHGIGHPIGLDVHDVSRAGTPFAEGWVITCEPGIYLPEEKLGIRIEDTIVVTTNGPQSLMEDIPIEANDVEDWMASSSKRSAPRKKRA